MKHLYLCCLVQGIHWNHYLSLNMQRNQNSTPLVKIFHQLRCAHLRRYTIYYCLIAYQKIFILMNEIQHIVPYLQFKSIVIISRITVLCLRIFVSQILMKKKNRKVNGNVTAILHGLNLGWDDGKHKNWWLSPYEVVCTRGKKSVSKGMMGQIVRGKQR